MRTPGSTEGLTKKQAEAKLREIMDGAGGRVITDSNRTIEHVGRLQSAKLSGQGRKISHVETFDSHLRVHLAPFFKQTPINRVGVTDVERLIASLEEKKLAPKTIKNVLGSLHSIFDYALRKGWVAENPCRLVDKPRIDGSDPDIRFLTLDELDAVVRAIPDHRAKGKLTWEQVSAIRASPKSNCALARDLGVSDSLVSRIRRGLIWTDRASTENIYAEIDRALILTAAMTGGRQGELLALRWRDVDWLVRKARVRRNFVRGQFGTPKSKRSSRGVPLAARVADALDDLHRPDRIPSRRRPRLRAPAYRPAAGPLAAAQALQALLQDCRHPRAAFHDLRHTFGTQMAAAGVPLRTLQEWMGHARLQDDADLRGLRAVGKRGRDRRGGIRGPRGSTVHLMVQTERNWGAAAVLKPRARAAQTPQAPRRSGCGPGGRGFESRRSPLKLPCKPRLCAFGSGCRRGVDGPFVDQVCSPSRVLAALSAATSIALVGGRQARRAFRCGTHWRPGG